MNKKHFIFIFDIKILLSLQDIKIPLALILFYESEINNLILSLK